MGIYSDKLAHIQVVINCQIPLHKCAPEKMRLPIFQARRLTYVFS